MTTGREREPPRWDTNLAVAVVFTTGEREPSPTRRHGGSDEYFWFCPPGAMTVMVVEDLADSAESLAVLLQMCGYRVTVARTGQEAPDLAASTRRSRHPGPPPAGPGRVGGGAAAAGGVGKQATVPHSSPAAGNEADYRRSAEAGIDLHLLKPADARSLLLGVLARLPRVLGLPERDGAGVMTETVADGKAGRSATELADDLRGGLTVILNAAHLLSVSPGRRHRRAGSAVCSPAGGGRWRAWRTSWMRRCGGPRTRG